MGFFDWWKKRNEPKNTESTPLRNPEEIVEFLLKGGLNKSISGEAVTPNNAMTVSAVNSAVRLLSESIGSLPLFLFKNVETEFGPGSERVTDNPLSEILSNKPNVWQTACEFKEFMMVQLLLRGNAYAVIVRRKKNLVQLLPVASDRVTVKQLDNMKLEYKIAKQKSGENLVFNQANIFHIRGMSVDGFRGASPLTWARETIGGAMALQRHGAALFGNGAFPSGVLQHPKRLDGDGIKNLQEQWEQQVGGDNQNKAVILEEGMEWKQTTMTSEDAQFLQSKEFSRSEIAAIFRVPPHMIGDLKRATFSNIESQETSFAKNSLAPWAVRWEQAIWRDLLSPMEQRDHFAKYMLQALMRGDTKTRADFYVKMVQNGIMSPNEIRALEELNPREGGDEFLTQLSMGSTENEDTESEKDAEEPDESGEGNEE